MTDEINEGDFLDARLAFYLMMRKLDARDDGQHTMRPAEDYTKHFNAAGMAIGILEGYDPWHLRLMVAEKELPLIISEDGSMLYAARAVEGFKIGRVDFSQHEYEHLARVCDSVDRIINQSYLGMQ